MEWDAIRVVVICAVPAFAIALLVGMRVAGVRTRFAVVAITTLSLLALVAPSFAIALAILMQLSGTSNLPEVTAFVGTAIVFIAAALGLLTFQLRYLASASAPRAFGASLVTVALILPLFVGAFLVQQKVAAALMARHQERQSDNYRLALVKLVEDYDLPIPYGYWTSELTLNDAERQSLAAVEPIHAGTLHHVQESVKSVPARVWDGHAYVEDRELPRTPWFELTESVARDVARQLHLQGYTVYLAHGIPSSSNNPGHVVTNASQAVTREYRAPIIYGVREPGRFGLQRDFVMYDIQPDPVPWASAPRIAIEVGKHVIWPRGVRKLTFPLDDTPLFECQIKAAQP